MHENAKFKATLAKITTNGKKTVLQLELNNKDTQKNYVFLTDNLDDEIIVQLGDPQMSMEFDEEKMKGQREGLQYSVQPGGEVEVEHGDEPAIDFDDEEEEQADEEELVDVDYEVVGDDQAETHETEEAEAFEDSSPIGFDEDLPDWAKDNTNGAA